jgi:lysozyme family protein
MTSAAFKASLPFILKWEGGYVNNPNDPGGATNKGVTQKVYDQWRTSQGLSARGVQQLGDNELQAIYESGYWLPPRCDALPSPLDLAQFDTAVNMGPGRAVRFLQQAIGTTPDGNFGPGTEQCVAGCDLGTTLANYCNTREAYYRDLVQRNAKLGVFLTGWINRLNALRKQIGLPGFEAADDEVNYGAAGYMARVPDIGVDPAYD